MKAGRILDAIIADKVMGTDLLSVQGIPEYSTNISAAWEVVEKIKNTRGRDGTFKI